MPAYCSGVAAFTVRKSCTLRMVSVSSGAAIAQPTRHPVTENVLLRLLTRMVRSRIPGSVIIGMCFRPS